MNKIDPKKLKAVIHIEQYYRNELGEPENPYSALILSVVYPTSRVWNRATAVLSKAQISRKAYSDTRSR